MPRSKAPLSEHVIVLDRIGPSAFRAHQETEVAPTDPAHERHVDALEGLLDLMPSDHPSRPALGEAVKAGRVPKERYLAPLESTDTDLHHVGDQRFVEVPYACSCGEPLATQPKAEVVEAWASHATSLVGVDEAILLDHLLVRLAGEPATALCLCGMAFQAGEPDPADPWAALARWEEHVRSYG